MDQDKIGITILNYNTWRESIQCIDSIVRNTQANYHIYLVDGCSTDDSIQKLQDYCEKKSFISFIKAAKNQGYSAGNNLGIKRAVQEGCNMVFIINSDVELLNNALDRMKESLLKNDGCMVVGSSILSNEGKEIQLAREKLTWQTFLFERHPLCYIPYFRKKALRTYKLPDSGKYIFQGSVSGCCFGIGSKDIEKIGYLDENVFLYYEEDILAYKMERHQKKAIVDCDAKIWHKANVSTNKEGSAFVRFHRWCSVLYLLKEYAKIKKWKQYLVCISNVACWMFLSIISKEYRIYLKKLLDKNIFIIRS